MPGQRGPRPGHVVVCGPHEALLQLGDEIVGAVLGAALEGKVGAGAKHGGVAAVGKDEDRGVRVPGAFKLEHLLHLKPIASWQAPICWPFIAVQFLLPQRTNTEKKENCQLEKLMSQRVLSAWAIQTGPFAAL